MKFTPRPYQKIMIDHALRNPRCALHVFMGAGKTSSTIGVIDHLRIVDSDPVLILAPLRVAQSTWPDEVEKWSDFKHLGICPIVGSAADRKKAIRQHADVFTCNYENIPWLVNEFGNNWPFRTIVADESTRLKSFRTRQGSVRARALAKVAWSKTRRFIELTGTPAPNGLQDLWGQLWFLDRGERLGSSYTAFIQRWFHLIRCPGFTKLGGPLPGAQEQIQNRVKDICMSLRVEDWFDVKDPIVVDVPVRLPDAAMRQYKEMEKEMLIEIGDETITAANAAAKSMKLLQLANGAIYTGDEGEWLPVHDAKLDALESIIEESAGAPVLVAYHFKSDLTRLQKRFPKGVAFGKDPKIVRDFNAGRIPVCFIHPASAGHGLNLADGGNILVNFAHSWDLELYQQVIERIGPVRQMQAGHPRPVYIYNITAVKTIDELVIARRTSKRSVQDLLMEAARRVK